jgi:DNA-binding CsgD family transcriptional regulator
MSASVYIYYTALVIVAVGSVALAYDLQRKYPFKYLSDFFYYLIVIYFYWFTILIVPDLLVSILGGDFEARSETINWLFVLFSFPCFLIGLYIFVSLFIHLRREKIPRWVVVVFLMSAIAFGIGLGIAVKFSIESASNEIVDSFYLVLRTFALCISPLIYLSINIPPLFFLGKYTKMIFKDRLLAQEDKLNFVGIFHKYGLSKREQEIFILMLEGKSNKEIGDDLFISVKTVKNHIYNIFQKLGVNSRLKLYIFIQNLANSK